MGLFDFIEDAFEDVGDFLFDGGIGEFIEDTGDWVAENPEITGFLLGGVPGLIAGWAYGTVQDFGESMDAQKEYYQQATDFQRQQQELINVEKTKAAAEAARRDAELLAKQFEVAQGDAAFRGRLLGQRLLLTGGQEGIVEGKERETLGSYSQSYA